MTSIKHKWKKRPTQYRRPHEYKEVVCTRLSYWRRLKLARLSEAQGHRCCYCCGDTFLIQPGEPCPKGWSWDQRATLEHLIPKCRDVQTNKDENLVMACSLCNGLRGERDPMGFYESLRASIFITRSNIQKPKTLSSDKLAKNKLKDGRTLALCLISFVMFPEESTYWAVHQTPDVKHNTKKRRKNKVRKIARNMLQDPRRLAA